MSIIFKNTGGGQVIANSVDVTRNRESLAGLVTMSAGLEDSGIEAGDVLLALGSGRSELDPFGIHCKLYGSLMKYLGPTVTVVISILSLLALLNFIIEKAIDIAKWLDGLLKSHWPWFLAGGVGFLAGAGVGFAGGRLLNDKDDASERLAKMSAQALAAFTVGLIPRPISGMVSVALEQLSEMGLGTSSRQASTGGSGNSGIANAITNAGTIMAGPAATFAELGAQAGAKLWSWLNSDGATAQDAIDELANAAGVSPSQVRAKLASLAQN